MIKEGNLTDYIQNNIFVVAKGKWAIAEDGIGHGKTRQVP